MPPDVNCPNCYHPMTLTRTISTDPKTPADHVYKCQYCLVHFITEDHEPVYGKRAS